MQPLPQQLLHLLGGNTRSLLDSMVSHQILDATALDRNAILRRDGQETVHDSFLRIHSQRLGKDPGCSHAPCCFWIGNVERNDDFAYSHGRRLGQNEVEVATVVFTCAGCICPHDDWVKAVDDCIDPKSLHQKSHLFQPLLHAGNNTGFQFTCRVQREVEIVCVRLEHFREALVRRNPLRVVLAPPCETPNIRWLQRNTGNAPEYGLWVLIAPAFMASRKESMWNAGTSVRRLTDMTSLVRRISPMSSMSAM